MPDDLSRTLADGMRDGKILIPSHEKGWDIVRRWAESPDDFIRQKISDFANGNVGHPSIPAEIQACLANARH